MRRNTQLKRGVVRLALGTKGRFNLMFKHLDDHEKVSYITPGTVEMARNASID
jgi:hypothetical protein